MVIGKDAEGLCGGSSITMAFCVEQCPSGISAGSVTVTGSVSS